MEPEPQSSGPIMRTPPARTRTAFVLGAACVLAAALAYGAESGALQQMYQALTGQNLPVPGPPVLATHSKLSEHELEWISKQKPQVQMVELLKAAINHDEGATDAIQTLLPRWKGNLKYDSDWKAVESTALYNNDLRVRAAAIEISLLVYNAERTPEFARAAEQQGETNLKMRPVVAWELGMLANRGVEPEEIHETLRRWAHDPDEQSRFWAVEGMAHIGTDDTIPDFLDVLKNDPSHDVRERAGCSLAKSGMLTREQRMKAVPGLLDLTDDASLDDVTRSWVYQALREITNVDLPNNAGIWRNWYAAHGEDQTKLFEKDPNSVLGNN